MSSQTTQNRRPWLWQCVGLSWCLTSREGGQIILCPGWRRDGKTVTLAMNDPESGCLEELNPRCLDARLIEKAWLLPDLAAAAQSVLDSLPPSNDRFLAERVNHLRLLLEDVPCGAADGKGELFDARV